MVIPRDKFYQPSKEIYVDRKVEVPIPVEKELSRWKKYWLFEIIRLVAVCVYITGIFSLKTCFVLNYAYICRKIFL